MTDLNSCDKFDHQTYSCEQVCRLGAEISTATEFGVIIMSGDQDKPKRVLGKMNELHSGPVAPGPIDPETGQNIGHWVLPEEDRAKGVVRPLRLIYTHESCGADTEMPQEIAETIARDPSYYSEMFCVRCKEYLPVGVDGELVWKDDCSKVGT